MSSIYSKKTIPLALPSCDPVQVFGHQLEFVTFVVMLVGLIVCLCSCSSSTCSRKGENGENDGVEKEL